MKCARCNSQIIVKNGHRSDGKQSYKCQDCKYRFVKEKVVIENKKNFAVALYCTGLTLRTIGALLGYSNPTILKWIIEIADLDFITTSQIRQTLEEVRPLVRDQMTKHEFRPHVILRIQKLLDTDVEIVVPALLKNCIIDD